MHTEKRNGKTLLTLFLSTLKISAVTFGGGYIIIPLMRRTFVQKLHWIDNQEVLDLSAIAQASPGSIAVNASILVGYRIAGILGALITMAGTILPPLVIISIISFFYAAFRSNPIVSAAMGGMLAGVAAVIMDVVITMLEDLFKLHRILPVIILAGAFIANSFLNINIIFIILVCGILGAFTVWMPEKEKGK